MKLKLETRLCFTLTAYEWQQVIALLAGYESEHISVVNIAQSLACLLQKQYDRAENSP